MRFIQINLNHCEAAHDLLTQSVRELDIDVAIISEPYKNLSSTVWATDSTSKSAIWSCGRYPFQEGMAAPEEGFVRAKIGGAYIYSCYAPPSTCNAEYEFMLNKIAADANGRFPIIIAGDFNAWSTEWGSRATNRRGRALLEAFSPLDITLANVGNTPTFRGVGAGSVVDITFVSNPLLQGLTWKVSEHYTHSDHQAIVFKLSQGQRGSDQSHVRPCRKIQWCSKRFDKDMFMEVLRGSRMPTGTATEQSVHMAEQISRACDASMPRSRGGNHKEPNYWWNDEIRQIRSECLQARRRYLRARARGDSQDSHRMYRVTRRRLREAIRSSKRESFKQLCKEADVNPWGGAYRAVMAKLKGKRCPQIKCPLLLREIVKTLFPPQSGHTAPIQETRATEVIPAVAAEELFRACAEIGDDKAPGLDGVPNKALKAAIRTRPDMFVSTFNACLKEGVFPKQWKNQLLVLLPKEDKPPGQPSSYRPICLLDTMGKILEKIVYNRLLPIVEEAGGLSERQYGFRAARSTVDAIGTVVKLAENAIEGKRWKGGAKKYCAVITLDVKNAFNSAKWEHIITSLQQLNIPMYILRLIKDYFTGRKLCYNTEEGPQEYCITGGVPQGSVLGPLLWNVMYDGILRVTLPREATIIGFADDIAVVVIAKHLDDVRWASNESIEIIKGWLKAHGLELAEHKTEAVLISSRKKREVLKVRVGEHEITSKAVIKYLGVMIDDRLNFKEHLEYAGEKAGKAVAALSRMMPNIGGPRPPRRLLLSRVVTSILLYAAPIWAKAMEVKSYREKLSRVYRLSALRVTSAFRTTSDEAAYVIAGMPPVDILADEMRRLYGDRPVGLQITDERRQEERAHTLRLWQERWDNSHKGRWTHRLIPRIEPWVRRRHGEVHYHLTQFLTGHGGYRKYLHRFGHDSSPFCPECPEEEDPEHVVFRCPRFDRMRGNLQSFLSGSLSVQTLVTEMLQSEEVWNAVGETITCIQRELRIAENARRTNNP